MESQHIWIIILVFSTVITATVIVFNCLFLEKIINYKVGEVLALKNGSIAWNNWVNTPIPVYMNVYIFTVVNPDEISKGGRPILKEQGPYVYREIRTKKNVTINEADDTVSYKQEILFEFDKEKSGNFSEDDEVTILNPGITTIVDTLNRVKPLQLVVQLLDFAIKHMFDSPNTVFFTTTPRKLLFEGEIIKCSQKEPNLETLLICSSIQNTIPSKTIKMKENGDLSFALLRHRNGTGMGEFEINAGIRDPKNLGKIVSWNKAKEISAWSGDPCNSILGNDLMLISPFQNSKSQITLYSTDVCSSVTLEYEEDTNFKDIPGIKFVPSPSFLGSVEDYPQNSCYCNATVKGMTSPMACLPKGAIDISGCIDALVILTKPHFLDASPEYIQAVDGLKPDPKKHSAFLEIEPRTGVPLRGYQRVQVNLFMQQMPTITVMEKLPNLLFPLLWLEEGAELEEAQVEMLNNMYINTVHKITIAQWIIIAIGILISLLSIIILLKKYSHKITGFTLLQ